MIDRDQLREALEWWDREARFDPHFMLQGFDTFIEAARLVADPDTLVVRKQKNGEWPERVLKVGDRFDMRIIRDDRPDQPSCAGDLLDALLEGQPK